jgi:hypothetical protein
LSPTMQDAAGPVKMATLDLDTVVHSVLCFIVVKYGPLSLFPLSSFSSPPFCTSGR